MGRDWRLLLFTSVFTFCLSVGQAPKACAQESKPAAGTAWQSIVIPNTSDVGQLERFIVEIKKRQPFNAEQYIEKQKALREVSKKIVEGTKDTNSDSFRKAEAEFVSASVMLLGNDGPDAQRKFFEKFQDYLTKREKIEFSDVQMAILAGQNLEQLPDRTLAKEAYKSFADIFRKKDAASLSDVIALLDANGRRLELPGKEFKLVGTTFSGEDFNVETLKNKFVLVYFWSSTVKACEQEHPYMLAVYEKYRERGFEIVGISLDEKKDEAQAFIKKLSIPWINLWDSRKNGVSKVMETYGVSAIPTVFLLDKENKVITIEARGLLLGKELERQLPDQSPGDTNKESSDK